jgi:hypothetical protein
MPSRSFVGGPSNLEQYPYETRGPRRPPMAGCWMQGAVVSAFLIARPVWWSDCHGAILSAFPWSGSAIAVTTCPNLTLVREDGDRVKTCIPTASCGEQGAGFGQGLFDSKTSAVVVLRQHAS